MAKKLVVLAGPEEGRVIPLGTETVLLGRSRATDTPLIDPHVSRVHCQVQPDGDRYVLIDFDSAGGTFVNGKGVVKHVLHGGDLIRIGNTHLQFVEDGPGAADGKAAAAGKRRPAGAWAKALVGQDLSHYKIGAALARGRTGYIFHARDTQKNLPVALKVLDPAFTKDEKKVKRFVAAMKVVLPLRHPNLIKVYGAGRTADNLWVAMEYVAGESLAAVVGRIAHAGKIDWRLIVRVGTYLARALDYAHGKKIVHQAVTPQNILLGRDPKDTKLIDLMLARALDEDPAKPISAAGLPSESLSYMSPERTDGPGAAVDARTDLYSLGATLYALFTGQPPFQGTSVPEVVKKIRLDAPKPLGTYQIEVPPRVEAALTRLMAKRPQDRYPTAKELVKELEGIAKAEKIPL